MSYARPPYVPSNLTRYDTFRTKAIYGAVLMTRWQDENGNLRTYPADAQGQTTQGAEEFLPTAYRRYF